MEDLTSLLSSSFTVEASSSHLNSSTSQHPYFSGYYKQKTATSNTDQNSRREKHLGYQRRKRNTFKDHARRLAENDFNSTEAEDDDNEMEDTSKDDSSLSNDVENMEVVPSYIKKIYKPNKSYKDQLMLSEWLVDVPDKLEDDWLMLLSPIGKRCLVVASAGFTSSYSRSGFRISKFMSHLPGGGNNTKGYTILDCIYVELERTYYILDCMCWNRHPIYDCETEFRFYWLMSSMDELSHDISQTGSDNQYKFIAVPRHSCQLDVITSTLKNTQDLPFQIDGLLFYHKRTHYTFGATPLVGWLKLYMLPEMLAVPIPEHMWDKRPSGYTTAIVDMETFNKTREAAIKCKKEKTKAHRRRKSDKSEDMEKENAENEDEHDSIADTHS